MRRDFKINCQIHDSTWIQILLPDAATRLLTRYGKPDSRNKN
jgi:hypothetical protein